MGDENGMPGAEFHLCQIRGSFMLWVLLVKSPVRSDVPFPLDRGEEPFQPIFAIKTRQKPIETSEATSPEPQRHALVHLDRLLVLSSKHQNRVKVDP